MTDHSSAPARAVGRLPRPTRPARDRAAALVASALVALAALGLAGGTTAGAAAGAALPPVSDYGATGPYQVASVDAGAHTIYYPTTVATDGVDHPIILWGNGTGATPSVYDGLLRHFASHGFVVAAAETTNAGSGQDMLAGIAAVQANPTLAAGADFEHVGSTGHSQGGYGATRTGFDPRIDTVFPIEPGPTLDTGDLTIPAIFFAGEDDTIVQPRYVHAEYERATQVPAAYAELAGATHFTALGSAGGFRAAATAWARWQLAGDTSAAALFAGTTPDLASDPAWSAYESNARLQALDGGSGPAPDPEPECEWWQWWCD